MTKAEFIRQQLARLPSVDFSNPAQAKILCPFHNDTRPSLDVALARVQKNNGRGVAVGGFNCWSCFPLSVPVWTEAGLKPIGGVHVGERVLSRGGVYRKVQRVLEQEKTGLFAEIKVASLFEPVKSTADHQFWAYRKESVRWGRKAEGSPEILKSAEWVQAQDLAPGDLLVFPKVQEDFSLQTVHLELTRFRQHGPVPFPIPETIQVDTKFAWVLGLYVAEGSSYRGPQFSLHKKETKYANRTAKFFKDRFGIECTHYEKKAFLSRRVYAPHSLLGKWFDEVCGKYARNKRIPDFIFRSPRAVRLAFLAGYFAGDGYSRKNSKGKSKRRAITSVSKNLGLQTRALAHSLGYTATLTTFKNHKKKKCDTFTVYWTKKSKGLKSSVVLPDSILFPIEGVQLSTGTEVVRDLTIEGDPSFCVYYFLVHNCSAHGGWNVLAEKLNLEKWDYARAQEFADHPSNPAFELRQRIKSLVETSNSFYEKPATDGPWEGSWRGLPENFLRGIEAESLWDDIADEYRILLPVRDEHATLVGHIAARGEPSQIPAKYKYLNSQDFPAYFVWYGLCWHPHPKVLVLTEGPFDALRLCAHGIPAVAALGINNLSDEKLMKILGKGCRRIVLAFDADDAGRVAVHGKPAQGRTPAVPGLAQRAQEMGFEVRDLNLSQYSPDKKMDPGNMPIEIVNSLRDFVATWSKEAG